MEDFLEFIQSSPDDLYDGYSQVKKCLLLPSFISKEKPVAFSLFDSIQSIQKTKQPIIPPCFLFISSDKSREVYEEFFRENLDIITSVHLDNQDDINTLLSIIKTPGIRILLGMRITTGTDQDKLPPPSDAMTNMFNSMFNKERLSHGGRALSKHSVRDSSNFWGECTGSVDKVNELASRVLEKMIQNAIWHNTLYVSKECVAYEIREENGYGMRWVYNVDGNIHFRGFLEPPFPDGENGHIKKWRH